MPFPQTVMFFDSPSRRTTALQVVVAALLGVLLVELVEGAVVTFGVLQSAKNAFESLSLQEVYVAQQYAQGIVAAVNDANSNNALGAGNSIRVVFRDVMPIFGSGAPEALDLFINESAITILSPNYYAAPAAMYVGAALGAPITGAIGADPTMLYSQTSQHMINYRFSFKEESWQMINIALNSKLRCKRFSVFYFNETGVIGLKDDLITKLKNLGHTNVTEGEYGYFPPFSMEWNQSIATMMSNKPHCIFFLSDAYSTQLMSYLMTLHPNFDPVNTFFILPSVGNAPNFAPHMNDRTFIVQQVPPPDDLSYDVVRNFKESLARLQVRQAIDGNFDPFGIGIENTSLYNSWTPTYYSLESYMSTRLAIEVVKSMNGVYSWSKYLSTVYQQKLFTVDDILIGPFFGGCTGMLNQTGSPCFCNSGNKVLYTTFVNGSGALEQYVPTFDLLEFASVSKMTMPMQVCEMPDTQVKTPTLFVSIIEASTITSDEMNSDVISYEIGFAFALYLIQAAGISRSTSGNLVAVIEVVPTVDDATVQRLVDRYPLAALAGGYQSVKMNVSGYLTVPGYADGVLQLTDPPVSSFRKEEIALEPVLADYVHSLATKLDLDLQAEVQSRVAPYSIHVVATSEAEAALAGKSLLTYSRLFTMSVHSWWESSTNYAIAEAGLQAELTRRMQQDELSDDEVPAGFFVLFVVSQNASYINATVRWAAFLFPQVRVLVASAEECLETLVEGLTTAEKARWASTTHNIMFASIFDNFWASRAGELTVGVPDMISAFEEVHVASTAMGFPIARNMAALRGIRTAAILWTAQDQIISVINPALFLNVWYEQGSITAIDEPLGRFYSTLCPPSILATGAVDRTCQCAKGPRRFFVHSLTDWVHDKSKKHANISFQYTLSYCGVKYVPYNPPKDYTAETAGSASAAASFIGALVFGFVYVLTRPKRDNRNAPKDPKKPFAIAFTDIQSSTSLWGRIPEEMGPAVDTHHEIMRKLIKEYKGYEVKTIGDSFMVAFHNAGSAVKFATSVQQKFFEYDWGTSAIDEVYRDLEREKAEEKAENEKETSDYPTNTTSVAGTPLIIAGNNSQGLGHGPIPIEGDARSPTAVLQPGSFSTHSGGGGNAAKYSSNDKNNNTGNTKDFENSRPNSGRASVSHPYMDSAALNSMDSKYWRGIRVRVGIHYGQGEIKHDPVTLGYDYYGTVVNTAARVEGVGNGGQVLLTEAAYEAALKDDAFKEIEASVTELGPQPLRGLDQPVPLYQVVPTALKGREFHALRLDIEHDASDSETENEGDTVSNASGISMDMTPEMMAQKMARRWHAGNTGGYGQALSNLMLMFNFQKHLYAPSNEKGRKGAVEHLATKWRVHLRKSKKLSSKALWEHHLMQVLLKVYPGFEKKDIGLQMRITARADSMAEGASQDEGGLGGTVGERSTGHLNVTKVPMFGDIGRQVSSDSSNIIYTDLTSPGASQGSPALFPQRRTSLDQPANNNNNNNTNGSGNLPGSVANDGNTVVLAREPAAQLPSRRERPAPEQ